MMKIQFTNDGQFKLAGASVDTYLLEKTRLVYQAKGEENFRIFYLVLSGAEPKMMAEWQLSDGVYTYLNHDVPKSSQHQQHFAAVTHSLSCLGVDIETQSALFSVVAALLHLGNVQFDEDEASTGLKALVNESAAINALNMSARLLGISSQSLQDTLTQRIVCVAGESITKYNSSSAASYARDALAKAIYSSLFNWVIRQVNKSLGENQDELPYIGVLDIFGFEHFDRNEFEQLLINYTNEVLLAMFKEQMFEAEKELYRNEGIQIANVEWADSSACVNAIANAPESILTALNEVCRGWTASDDRRFLSTLKQRQTDKTTVIFFKDTFTVQHFAGKVSYSIGTFVAKNNDAVPQDLSGLFGKSTSALVREMWAGWAETNVVSPRRRMQVERAFAKIDSTTRRSVLQHVVNVRSAVLFDNWSNKRCFSAALIKFEFIEFLLSEFLLGRKLGQKKRISYAASSVAAEHTLYRDYRTSLHQR